MLHFAYRKIQQKLSAYFIGFPLPAENFARKIFFGKNVKPFLTSRLPLGGKLCPQGGVEGRFTNEPPLQTPYSKFALQIIFKQRGSFTFEPQFSNKWARLVSYPPDFFTPPTPKKKATAAPKKRQTAALFMPALSRAVPQKNLNSPAKNNRTPPNNTRRDTKARFYRS